MREGSELHVVQAWNAYQENPLPYDTTPIGVGTGPREPEIHKRILNELLGSHKIEGLNPQLHLTEGNPEEVIPSLAREKHIELIVMGSVGRVGLPGFFIVGLFLIFVYDSTDSTSEYETAPLLY